MMIPQKIESGLYQITVKDTATKFFEAIWEIPEGVTYNSYLLDAGESFILFDTVKEEFSEEFVRAIERITPLERINTVVLHHLEPDHAGALKDLLKERGREGLTTLVSPMGKRILQNLYGISGNFIKTVKDGELIALGNEKIRFIYVPWLHWPETMVSYLENRKFLLSGDIFGSFSLMDSARPEYIHSAKKYFATVIGAYRNFVPKALKKLSPLKIKQILPAHGIIWKNPEKVIALYRGWVVEAAEDRVVLLCATMYGRGKKLVEKLKAAAEEKGIKLEIFCFDDQSRISLSEFVTAFYFSKALVILSPTYENGLFPLLAEVLRLASKKVPKNKKIIGIVHFSWGGTAVKELESILEGFDTKIIQVQSSQLAGIVNSVLEILF